MRVIIPKFEEACIRAKGHACVELDGLNEKEWNREVAGYADILNVINNGRELLIMDKFSFTLPWRIDIQVLSPKIQKKVLKEFSNDNS